MAKIVFIGAGSLEFSRKLMLDILSFPALRDAQFELVDVDPKRLDYARRVAERIVQEANLPATVHATLDRREALAGADYVLIMILSGGIEVIRQDIEIPMKYGVDQCIGDTLGPGGVFRALRTIPVILDIARDMEELCPEATILNYTNPMPMICWALEEATAIKYVGLCHSVQGTARQLAEALEVPYREVSYWVAGINHQAWFLEFQWQGNDAYPLLRERINYPEFYGKETTRVEMFKHLGYFVTESSGHNSEYNPWFRKRKDLLAKYTPGGAWNGESGFVLKLYGADRADYEQKLERIASGQEPLDFTRSDEYGSYIINALEGEEITRINGNVKNQHLITNLPYGCCVEVPCLVDRQGIHPCYVGDLPPQLAALNRTNVNVEELAVQAVLRRDRDMAYYAVALDPLTSAVLSLEEIRQMVDEMFEAERDWLSIYG
ncbi:MAG TPA: alpha-glucosidase/alpha-galactosidase [Atribacteraceae bacterium]|nr:alpha-glucosidase/alpha-galactosidase [Atribacteraceae bacterium]